MYAVLDDPEQPQVHVWQLAAGSSTPTPPAAPTNVRILSSLLRLVLPPQMMAD